MACSRTRTPPRCTSTSPATHRHWYPTVSATGPPEWQRVSGEPSYRWHDHRAHWMGGDPPLVTARPDQRQTVAEWTVPMRNRRPAGRGRGHHRMGARPIAAALGRARHRRPLRSSSRWRCDAGSLPRSSWRRSPSPWHRWRSSSGPGNATAEAAIGKLPMLAMPFFVVTMLIGAVFLARSRPNDALILAAGAGGITALHHVAHQRRLAHTLTAPHRAPIGLGARRSSQ